MSNSQNPEEQKIVELCREGKVLEAIKYYRVSSGAGLKESKDHVDHIITKYGILVPKGSTGCFIATACYGDYDAPEVLVLRKFRDDKLLNNKLGKALVSFYYHISPALADKISRSSGIKLLIRKWVLRPIVSFLKNY